MMLIILTYIIAVPRRGSILNGGMYANHMVDFGFRC